MVIPGGFAPDHMRRDPHMVALVAEVFAQGKVIAAICHAGWMLCEADIVRDRTVASFFSIRTDLENAGANWVDQVVARDGNLITARIPSDLPAFCRELVSALCL